MKTLVILFLIILSSNQIFAQSYNMPESIVFDGIRNRYLISNAGSGTIVARSSLNGQLSWFVQSGLSSPKGMVIIADTLFVTDVNKVKGFNLTSGTEVFSVSISGASFLNDIETDGAGNLFISDTQNDIIFRVKIANGAYSTFVSSGISSPNGLLLDKANNRLLLCSFRANSPIQAISLADSSVSTVVTTALSELDGLTFDNNNRLYVSSWSTNAVYRFPTDFSSAPVAISSSHDGPADIYYNKEHDTLAIPNMNNSAVTFIGFATSFSQLLNPLHQINISGIREGEIILDIESNKTCEVVIRLISADGKNISEIKNLSLTEGLNSLTIVHPSIKQGFYLLSLVENGQISDTIKLLLR